jgi:3'-5' exoribonuclease
MDLQIKKEYMIFELAKATAKDGKPYLRMVMSDEGNLMNAIMFDSSRLPFEPKKGDVVEVSATLQHYNDKPQLKVNEMWFVSAGGAESFLPKSKNNPDDMMAELVTLLEKHVTNEWLIKLIKAFRDDETAWKAFTNMPAAKSVHHAYLHGLLEHTLGAVRMAVKAAPLYPQVNKDLVITGAFFHDVGKITELDTSAGFDYSDNGRLLGHLILGHDMLRDYIAKIEGFPLDLKSQLLHIMLSHHGLLEFGSPQVPKTSEAVLVHFVDDLDGKMNAISSVLARDSVNPGEWSTYDRILERQIFLPKQ